MPFGCLLPIIRSVFTLIFGTVIFFAFLVFLMVTTVRDNFLSSDFYTESFAEDRIYDRFYNEVLLDPEFQDTIDELLGDIEVPIQDIATTGGLVAKIIPPEYLQDQVEGAVVGVINYLNKTGDNPDVPDVFIDLGPPLDNVKPVLLDYIDKRIDALDEVPVTTMDALQEELEALYRTVEMGKIPTTVPSIEDPSILVNSFVDTTIAELTEVPADTPEEFERAVEGLYEELAVGNFPLTLPSIEGIPIEDRLAAYDDALEAVRIAGLIPEETLDKLDELELQIKAELEKGSVKGALRVAAPELTKPVVNRFVDDAYDMALETLQDEGFPQSAIDGLEDRKEGIKEQLGEGNIKESLKLGARALVGPLIDNALDDLREDLDDQDRIDLVAKAAKQNGETKEEFLDRRELDIVRNVIDQTGIGLAALTGIIVLAVLAMAAVQFPHIGSGLRLPGLSLLSTGLIFLVVGIVMKFVLPSLTDDLVKSGTTDSPIPPELVTISADVLFTMAEKVADAIIVPSITVAVIGLALLLASFFVRALHIPFLSR